MSRRWFLIVPLILVFFLLFQNWIVFKTIEYTLYNTLQESFAGDLKWESIEHKGSTVVIRSPKVTSGEDVHFTAEMLTLHWDFQVFSRTLVLDLEALKPQWPLAITKIDLCQSKESGLLRFIHIKGALKIIEGKLTHSDGVVEVDLDSNFIHNKNFKFSLKEGEKRVEIIGEEVAGEIEARMQASKFDLALVTELTEAFCPQLVKEKFKSGTLDGHFALRIVKDFRPQMEGILSVHNLRMVNLQEGLELEAGALYVDLNPTEPTIKKIDFPWLPAIKGSIMIYNGGKISFDKKGKRPFALSNLKGEFRFKDNDKADFEWEGVEEYRNQKDAFNLKGGMDYHQFENMAVDLDYRGNKSKENPAELILDGFSLGGNKSLVHFEIKNFGLQQFSILEAVLKKISPESNPLDFYEGEVDAKVSLNLVDSKISTLAVENIAIRNLSCAAKSWECDFGAKNVSGFLKMNLSEPNPTETIESELLIVKGALKLNTLPEDLWKFTDIETKLVVHKGIVQKSVASVTLAGMTGKADMDWQSISSPLRMSFSGKGADIAKFMPAKVKSGLERRSLVDEVNLDIAMKKEGQSRVFKGDLVIRDPHQGLKYLLNFGFDLKPPPKEEEFTGHQFAFWFDVAPTWLSPLFSPYANGMAEALISKKQSDIGIFGTRLTDGWFEAKGIPLEKFASSYMFRKDDIVLSGNIDLKGSFDLKGLELFYSAQNMVLESAKVRMEMKSTPARSETLLTATHRVDFSSGEHRGSLPLSGASYYDKIKGIIFTNLEGEALFLNKKIFMPDLEATMNGVFLKGSLLVDNTDPREGAFDVFVDVDIMDGSLEAVNRSMQRIEPDFFLAKIPLNGTVQLNKAGAKLAFNVLANDLKWDAKVSGALSDGTLDFGLGGLSSKGVNLNFDYDHGKDLLSIQDMGGTFFLGDQDKKDEIHYLLKNLDFVNLAKKEGHFDIRLFDKQGDLFYLVGDTVAKDNHVAFIFDPGKSHLGNVKPGRLELETENLSRVKHFALDLDLDLENVFKGIQRISKANLLVSPETVSELHDFKGHVKSQFTYEEGDSKLHFKLQGHDITLQNKDFKNFLLAGDFQEGVLKVQDGSLDEFSFSLAVSKKKNNWELGHLALKAGESLMLGLEGEWDAVTHAFNAKVNLIEVFLDKLHEYDVMKPFVEEFDPQGVLKGSGNLILTKGKNDFGLVASLTTHFKDLAFKNFHFREIEPSTLRFEWNKGIEFLNVKTSLIDPKTSTSLVELNVDKIALDFADDRTLIENLHYKLAYNHLSWLADELEKAFPAVVTPFVKESVSLLKKEGLAQGSLDIQLQDTETKLTARLADGTWHLMGWDAEVKQFSMEVDNEEIKLSTQYNLENQLIWVLARTPRPDYNSGVVLIADGLTEEKPVTIHWHKRPGSGVVISRVEGVALGLRLDLREDPEHKTSESTLRLKGEAGIDLRRASLLLSPELREKIADMGLGEGWGLRGLIEVEKAVTEDKRPYTFKGELHGQNFELKGFRFERLYADLFANQHAVRLKDFVIEDQAGTLAMKEGALDKNQNEIWSMDIPLLVGYDIRPSLLWEADKNRSKEIKPLMIKEMQIQDLSGPFSPLADIRGRGYLNFVNPVKKNLQNTIFAIPGEILSRIGIDMIALTPVTGSIIFEIADEKVQFIKFKDVFSDGKLSKFYLADKGPSYMDFDGTLHMQVKMKQYTLLFKLAELFTFDIGGNLAKPVYSIHKGNKG